MNLVPGGVLWIGGLLLAQQPEPAREPEREPEQPKQQEPARGQAQGQESSLPPAELAQARAAIRALGERHRELQTLECNYEQLRSSALLVEPLRSAGKLRWRREPPCLVFEVKEPRLARLRLDERRYEVLRPERKQLERFAFAGPELPRALLHAFAPDLAQIEQRMQIRGVERTGPEQSSLRIRFAPTDGALQDVLSSLSIEVDPRDATLRAIAYTDAQGDEVELQLRDIVRDPELREDAFELRAEPGTRVLEHPAPKPKGKAQDAGSGLGSGSDSGSGSGSGAGAPAKQPGGKKER